MKDTPQETLERLSCFKLYLISNGELWYASIVENIIQQAKGDCKYGL